MKMKQMSDIRQKLSLLLGMVLIAATALSMVGCSNKTPQTAQEQTNASTEVTVLGEGETTVSLTVVDSDGKETPFEIHTDEETVGKALLACGLVKGEDGPYGLYITEVNGITADFNANGTYWAFYINGEYATTGVDVTPIAEGDTYALKVEK